MRKYIMPIEDISYIEKLERLNYEINSYGVIIDRLISSHLNDANFLNSEIWKTYYNNFVSTNKQYEQAKNEFTSYLMPIVRENENNPNLSFSWNIEDFSTKTVEIIIED